MIDAVLSSPKASRRMTELSDADRAWLVAGLRLAGVPAQDTADRTGCSLRLVRAIGAEVATLVAEFAQVENRALHDEVRGLRIELSATRLELARSAAEVERLRVQRDQMLDSLAVGGVVRSCGKGHPMLPYNTYLHQGRPRCRECRRVWDLEKRKPRAA